MNYQSLPEHIVQSEMWGKFKTKMGTKAVQAGGAQFTLHKIPLLPYYIGYCPKVNPEKIKCEALQKAGKEHHCAAIRFDCPNVIKNSFIPGHSGASVASDRISETLSAPTSRGLQSDGSLTKKTGRLLKQHCHPAPHNTFAKRSVFLDITPSEEKLLAKMKSKTRYNIRYAERQGITVEERTNQEGLEMFLNLQQETAQRQGFLIHSNKYYRTLFETLNPRKMVHILVANAKNTKKTLAAYMLFNYKNVLYYPYGGSSVEKRNFFPSNLLMWEAIRLGKHLGCNLFDMWGATANETDPWWGFTRFKLGYGGELVEFIDSYDLVINPLIYTIFNLAYSAFWKINRTLRKARN